MKTRREELHVLTGGYALDVLDEPEREEFERHLRRCASCAAEVRGLRETAARLAMAVALQPPPAMGQRVLAAAYRIRQLPPLAGQRLRAGRWHFTGRVLGGRRGSDHGPGRQPQGRRALRPRLAAGLAAASLAVAVALGAAQISIRHQLDAARTASAEIATVVGAPDARVEKMATSAGGTVIAVVSAGQHAAVVSTRGMAALPAGRIYQLWVMTPVGARSAALLPGTGRSGPDLASGVRPGDKIGITVEPAGGTSRPTTIPVVVMPVTA